MARITPRYTSYPTPRRVTTGTVSKPSSPPKPRLSAQLPPTRRVKYPS